jgi:hypothetical protein
MAGATVRITGLREVDRAFRQMEKDASKELRKALVEAAEPVAVTARQNLAKYHGISLGTIGPRAVARGAFVTQRAKKVTGLRGDFGALQMRVGLMPALEAHADDVMRGAEHVIDLLASRNGF